MSARNCLATLSLASVIVLSVQCSSPSQDQPSADAASTAPVVKQKGGADEFGPYEPVENWPQLLPGSEGYTWGSTPGIFAETPNKVWIIQRGEIPLSGTLQRGQPVWSIGLRASAQWERSRKKNFLFTVDGDGKLLKVYDEIEALFAKSGHPHSVTISPYDPEKHVWIIDDHDNQIMKLTNDGHIVMTLGVKGVSGNDESHFNGPTGIAFRSDGGFYISDGYRNHRVVRFDKDGKFVLAFGEKGTNEGDNGTLETRPGYMNTIHSVAVGPDQRVYVADRANNRVQVFDENGKYLDQWPIRMPYFILVTDKGIVVSSGFYEKIVRYDYDGHLEYSWGTGGAQAPFPGGFFGLHGLALDTDGNFYVSESTNGRAQKFRPRKDADPSRFPGKPLGVTTS